MYRNVICVFLGILLLSICSADAINIADIHNNFTSLENSSVNASNNSGDYGNIFFIQLADIHLCGNDEVKEVFGGTIPPVNITKKAISEILNYNPEVVVDTGDIVALADRYDLDTDERWYKLVNSTICMPLKQHGIPFLFAPGNHDPAGYRLDNVNKSDPRYYNGLLLKYLDNGRNKTYYSYDVGKYHFIMLDPYETPESGYRAVTLPKDQLEWLANDLANNKDKYIIIAYHQPLGSWDDNSYKEFINLISPYKGHIMLIAGHTHDNRLIYRNGIPEYQGGAVCGDWWQTGKTPDGNPLGYVIYYIKNGSINRFYKGIGLTKQINVLSPVYVVLNESVPLELNVYYENETIANITYRIDNGKPHLLNITLINATKIWWYHAKGVLTPTPIDNRKHNITIIVTAKDGKSFNRTIVYKFSNGKILPISEIKNDSNFNDYYGKFVTINGTITMVGADGNLLDIVDNSGDDIIIWAGDCKHKEFNVGDKIILTGQVTQFKGTKELKLVSDSDAIIYGHTNMTSSLIILPNISVAYKNYTTLKNKYVEVHGVVTAVFGNEVIIQDSTRGIQLWLGEIKHGAINVGNNITIRGQLSEYKGMIEIVAGLPEDLIINGNATLPNPKEISIKDIPNNLGNLVICNNLTVKYVDNSKIIVSDGVNNTTIYCRKAGFNPSEIVKKGDKISVIGIAYLYKSTYEICPRSKNDIINFKLDNETEKAIKGIKVISGKRFNLIKLELNTGDDLVIPVIAENITINKTVIKTLNEIKQKVEEISLKSKDEVDNVIKELNESIKPLLLEGFNITNKEIEKEITNNEVISKIEINATNTSNKGFAIIAIPIGDFEVKNVTVNNGTANITLKENDYTTPIGWYEVNNKILKITIVKDPEINVVLATTFPTATSSVATSKTLTNLKTSHNYPEVAGDVKSLEIKRVIYDSKLIVGSDIDANLSARCLKEDYEKVGKEFNITEDCILIGGPVVNPVVKKYMDKFPIKINNTYPGKNKGVIQVITLKVKVGENIYNYVTVVLLAGSDRWGTKAAVEYFKQLEDLPKEPIFVEWRDGKAVKIEKP